MKGVLKLETINKITFIVSASWKYKLFNEFKEVLKETKDFSLIMKKLMPSFKEHAQELSKVLPKLIQNQPDVVLTENKELEILKDNVSNIKKEFSCEIVIEEGDKFKHDKSIFALPGKPALLIE